MSSFDMVGRPWAAFFYAIFTDVVVSRYRCEERMLTFID